MCRSFAGIGGDLYTLLACVPEIICTGLAVGCQTTTRMPREVPATELSAILSFISSRRSGFLRRYNQVAKHTIVLDRGRAGRVRAAFPLKMNRAQRREVDHARSLFPPERFQATGRLPRKASQISLLGFRRSGRYRAKTGHSTSAVQEADGAIHRPSRLVFATPPTTGRQPRCRRRGSPCSR